MACCTLKAVTMVCPFITVRVGYIIARASSLSEDSFCRSSRNCSGEKKGLSSETGIYETCMASGLFNVWHQASSMVIFSTASVSVDVVMSKMNGDCGK